MFLNGILLSKTHPLLLMAFTRKLIQHYFFPLSLSLLVERLRNMKILFKLTVFCIPTKQQPKRNAWHSWNTIELLWICCFDTIPNQLIYSDVLNIYAKCHLANDEYENWLWIKNTWQKMSTHLEIVDVHESDACDRSLVYTIPRWFCRWSPIFGKRLCNLSPLAILYTHQFYN